MRKQRVIIAGLCRDMVEFVGLARRRAEELGAAFADYRVVVMENDSRDGTRAALKEWASANPRVQIVECPDAENCMLGQSVARAQGELSPERMRKMAGYRNRLLQAVRALGGAFDLVCMLDMDLQGPICLDGVAHSMGADQPWDSVSAMGLMGMGWSLGQLFYYDTLAYEDEDIDIEAHGILHAALVVARATSWAFQCDRPGRLRPVRSGFAGLALYRMQAFSSGADFTPADGVFRCEHKILHANMRARGHGRIYINPRMLLLAGRQGISKRSIDRR
jgi:hypothetical protein